MAELAPAGLAPLLPGRAPHFQIPKPANASAGFHLFLLGAPFAIAGFIASIVVDAIKLMLGGWAASHVREKVLVLHPAFANGNPPTAPVLPIFTVGIATAFAHCAPRAPLWRLVTFTMCPTCHEASMAQKLLQV